MLPNIDFHVHVTYKKIDVLSDQDIKVIALPNGVKLMGTFFLGRILRLWFDMLKSGKFRKCLFGPKQCMNAYVISSFRWMIVSILNKLLRGVLGIARFNKQGNPEPQHVERADRLACSTLFLRLAIVAKSNRRFSIIGVINQKQLKYEKGILLDIRSVFS